MSSSLIQLRGNRPVQIKGDAEEEWVTTKKVEIVTKKNVERKIQRQVVLEDGRVVEEELPTVTVDTTEDKQTFETDQDEQRNLEGQENIKVASKFDTSGGVLVGDKFTSTKKVNDVRENLVKTEALQDLGNLRSKDVKKVLDDGDDIRKYLKCRDNADQQVSIPPRTVYASRSHRVVTDKEDTQERNWVNKGKMQNERIRTEEHIEYDSDDSPEDGSSSSSSKSSHFELEPEVYKTRKDENFVEYFKVGKENNNNRSRMIKVGDGPHYVSESKEVQREDETNELKHKPYRPTRSKELPRHILAEADANKRRNKKTINHTDSWLERHFGSNSSLSASSTELSRPGSREGYGIRRSASICDIRPVGSSANAFYATVRKSGQIANVSRRDKKLESQNNAVNRVSANFSSSGHPVRPPRKIKKPDYEEVSFSTTQGKIIPHSVESLPSNKRSRSAHHTEKYYFGNPVTVKKVSTQSTHNGNLHSGFSSVQNLQSAPVSEVRKIDPPRKERSSISSRHRRSGDVFLQSSQGEFQTTRDNNNRKHKSESSDNKFRTRIVINSGV